MPIPDAFRPARTAKTRGASEDRSPQPGRNQRPPNSHRTNHLTAPTSSVLRQYSSFRRMQNGESNVRENCAPRRACQSAAARAFLSSFFDNTNVRNRGGKQRPPGGAGLSGSHPDNPDNPRTPIAPHNLLDNHYLGRFDGLSQKLRFFAHPDKHRIPASNLGNLSGWNSYPQ